MATTMRNEPKNWKQEPLVWLLIAIPFTAVVMGVVMMTLAIQSYSGLVVDDYYKKGKQINRVLARDRFAHELGLAAAVRLADDGLVESVDGAPALAPGESGIERVGVGVGRGSSHVDTYSETGRLL